MRTWEHRACSKLGESGKTDDGLISDKHSRQTNWFTKSYDAREHLTNEDLKESPM